jgi:hypothetical protein
VVFATVLVQGISVRVEIPHGAPHSELAQGHLRVRCHDQHGSADCRQGADKLTYRLAEGDMNERMNGLLIEPSGISRVG